MTHSVEKSSLVYGLDIYGFLKDIRFVLLFYVIGDLLTTIYAIETGLAQEGNPVVSAFASMNGLYSIVLFKVLFIVALLGSYVYIVRSSAGKEQDQTFAWNALRHTLAIIGMMIMFNNLLVMGGFVSPVYLLLSYATSLLV
ncbi:MAG: hypothetical protein A4E24_01931 [Methanomethylovorans sp. PtaU1.Bin093]|jgi:hypothetical protein|uniref:DUF5658 family protein n=1 Tax=Methanomethylovorans sp. PtaU1.Bin093 TaxID=1811679 RepID=UPI0009D0AE58|nr:DUF5658 family protein [Methanomethylovorans sp. PtaU1.Bin093]OPY18516.1 MAG: hypothetical protein A4E24_01931 [Methanomethylovorans sp. PtaU1.Bin093]